ncbi:MAG: right-handed parallel beta-helix repeat-containing protein [Saprospiraceae bacterium]|nr:right-handed parallel beta-helix repeat-containing protein [Saprospiraceae bacterium]
MNISKKRIAGVIAMFFVISIAQAQFSQLLKDAKQTKKEAEQAVNEVKKTTGSGAKTAGNATAEKSEKTGNGRDWYISKAGSGKEGTREKPAKEIGAIADQLKPGDVIHIAGGEYKGKMDAGSDLLTVPVSIIGGYSADFSSRDPWGKTPTLLSGTNEYMKSSEPRLIYRLEKTFKTWSGEIIIDGLVIDHGPRNQYVTPEELAIKRKATPEKGFNPSPEYGGIDIKAGEGIHIAIRNCIVMNTAPTEGAVEVQVGKNAQVLIENNLIINNTGEGIYCKTAWQSDAGAPQFQVRNNSILFTWKHDAIATYGGNSLKLDTRVVVTAENNVFAFGDYGGVDNIKNCKQLTLKGNLFVGHRKYDYREVNDGMSVADMADYASCTQSDNFSTLIKPQVSRNWAERYANRQEISREQVDASVKVSNSAANQVRSMFGLPLQGSSVKTDAEVWLHRLSVEDAIRVGIQSFEGKGCSRPNL